jgi:hypothetical protein
VLLLAPGFTRPICCQAAIDATPGRSLSRAGKVGAWTADSRRRAPATRYSSKGSTQLGREHREDHRRGGEPDRPSLLSDAGAARERAGRGSLHLKGWWALGAQAGQTPHGARSAPSPTYR